MEFFERNWSRVIHRCLEEMTGIIYCVIQTYIHIDGIDLRLVIVQMRCVSYVKDTYSVKCAAGGFRGLDLESSAHHFFFQPQVKVKMGLAGPRIKQRISADPNNLHWSNGM